MNATNQTSTTPAPCAPRSASPGHPAGHGPAVLAGRRRTGPCAVSAPGHRQHHRARRQGGRFGADPAAVRADGYFQPRPSGAGYDPMAAAGSNQARTNPDLRKRIDEAPPPSPRAKASPRRTVPIELDHAVRRRAGSARHAAGRAGAGRTRGEGARNRCGARRGAGRAAHGGAAVRPVRPAARQRAGIESGIGCDVMSDAPSSSSQRKLGPILILSWRFQEKWFPAFAGTTSIVGRTGCQLAPDNG